MTVQLRDLGAEAARLLQLFADQLVELDIEIPETQMVSPGSIPAWDGEMLVCSLQRVDQGHPGATQPGTMYRAVFAVTFAVTLVRSVPALFGDGQPGPAMIPAPEDVTVSGTSGFDDAAALIVAAAAIHEGNLFTDPGDDFEIGGVTPVGPQGGLAGQSISITTSVS